MAQKRGYKTVKVQLVKSELTLRGGQKLVHAAQTLTADMTLYEGVRFAQILEAVYEQGRKDGARRAFEEVDKGVRAATKAVPPQEPRSPAEAHLSVLTTASTRQPFRGCR
jgi:hypothetical protein